MFDFIGTLSESRLIPTTTALKYHTASELAELCVLNICAIYILHCDKHTHDWADSYAKKTVQYNDFEHWRSNSTDLYMMLYALTAPKVELKDQEHSDEFKNSLPLGENLLIRWLRDIGAHRNSSVHRNLFTNLDFNFKIKNSAVRAIRRLVMEWETLDKSDRQLAMTRMLQIFRAHATKSEVLPYLRKVADRHDWELDNVCNQETGEGCSAPSHGYENDPNKKKKGGGFIAALAGAGVGYGAAKLLNRVHESFDGDNYFDPTELENQRNQNHMSRSRLVYMPPAEFLEVAEQGYDDAKQSNVDNLVNSGVKFSGIPFIMFDHDGEGIAVVTGHEGRHRARALMARGVESMPVLLTHSYSGNGQSMRWGSVNSDGFDRFNQKWPHTLFGQKGENGEHNRRNIPFPVPDLRESASAGATGAASIATSVGGIGAGFDPNGDYGVYPKTKKQPLIRR